MMLIERGYRKNVINSALDRVRQLDRHVMLEKVERNDQREHRVRAVFEYDKRLPNLSGIMRKNWQTMVQEDKRLLKVFPQPPMICYTRPKNIKDRLIRAKLPPIRTRMVTREQEDGFKRCNKSGCKLCSFCGEGTQNGLVKSVQVSHTGEDYKIRGRISCSTKNILYLLTCSKGDRVCPRRPQYGGETGQEAAKRFTEHHATVTMNCHQHTTTPVGQHFCLPGHSISDCQFVPVERIWSNNVFVRKTREKLLINQLELIDHGLNKRLG